MVGWLCVGDSSLKAFPPDFEPDGNDELGSFRLLSGPSPEACLEEFEVAWWRPDWFESSLGALDDCDCEPDGRLVRRGLAWSRCESCRCFSGPRLSFFAAISYVLQIAPGEYNYLRI